MSAAVAEFTPTERRFIALLSDGLPHTPAELICLLPDELGSIHNVRDHISRIRKKLRPAGQDILCEIHNRRVHYRHVRLLRIVSE